METCIIVCVRVYLYLSLSLSLSLCINIYIYIYTHKHYSVLRYSIVYLCVMYYDIVGLWTQW